MKRTVILIIMSLYLLTAVFSLVVSGAVGEAVPEAPKESEPATVSPDKKAGGYIVRAIDGVVAVEDEESGKIIEKTSTRVAILPEKDRKLLEKGIYAENTKKMRGILEDLCS